MTSKQLVILVIAAGVFGVAAYLLSSGSKPSGAKLNGKAIFPDLAISDVARVEFGDKLTLASGDGGWTVETFHGYPADHAKLAENLLKLTELKVGQVVRGMKLESSDALVLKDAAGKAIASLTLGEKHAKWGHGRYAAFAGETVLVSDSLDAFDNGWRAWVDTKIVDTPRISFRDIAEGVPEEELGFATGVVAKVTIAGDTNRVATIGNVVKGGGDRYLKLDDSPWVFLVPDYSLESLLPKPPPEAEKEEEPAAEKPAAEEPAKEQPAEEPAKAKPAAEKPAATEPAKEQPAAGEPARP